MRYWNWVTGYALVSVVNAVAFMTRSQEFVIFTSIACLLYLAVYFCWPYLASPEQKNEMAKVKEQYQKEDEVENEQIQDRMKEWIVAKIYNDQEDSLQFHNDKALLDNKKIPSLAKSSFGITTISVKEADLETACSVLGVDVPVEDSGNA